MSPPLVGRWGGRAVAAAALLAGTHAVLRVLAGLAKLDSGLRISDGSEHSKLLDRQRSPLVHVLFFRRSSNSLYSTGQ